ncbi:MAG: HAD family hydrolase [Methylococcaceae bacterium]|nr:HAD family hydrolase [Methylococcaceae bacterium]
MNQPIIYALDFDGVICDSAVETALTGWKAASQLWHDMPDTAPPSMEAQFRRVRPMIETGYEAILAMRMLHLGHSVDTIVGHYAELLPQLLSDSQATVDELKIRFGATRDAWIAENRADWVQMNPLFAGIADKLRQLAQQHTWYIVTTKQERFVQHILTAHGIDLAQEQIFGLDRAMSKVDVLLALQHRHPEATLYFVEDRLPTLINVSKHPDLSQVQLILARWGYNTEADQQAAAGQFVVQELGDFLGEV